MKYEIHIGIAEDHVLVRQGFIRMLQDHTNIKILFEVGNGKDLLKQLQDHKPSIILLDIAMPVMGGIKAIEKVKERYPKVKIIVISAYSEDISIIEYVKLGANSFLNKECDVDTLLTAIETVYDKGSYFSKDISKLLSKYGLDPNKDDKRRELTDREIEVLTLLCADLTYNEIADKIGINARTVQWYEQQLFKKTKCKDMKALKTYAINNELIA